ncbi:unnamed protein product [Cuscuta epithymum]|uniref:BED-type domain-containing protein n=1 Tax=Cuscuta epithymum TaxID=186058 RepID=A0AAV0CUK4_9ASTE|nr:unnamed protein product [Cuscuta epithymum]
MATPEVPTTPEAPAENKETVVHNSIIAHDGMTVKNEGEAHDGMAVKNEGEAPDDEMMSHADIVGHAEIVAHNETVVHDETVAHDETIIHNETVTHCEAVATDETATLNSMVAHGGVSVKNEEEASSDAHADIVGNDDVIIHIETVVPDAMVVHGEMVGPDSTVVHSEMVAQDDMMAQDDMIAHDELVAQDEVMVRDGVMPNGEIMTHREIVPHDEILFNNNMAHNDIVPIEAPIDYIETPPNSSEAQPNKRRKKKSIVWEHFTIEAVGDGCRRACCKDCKQSFAYSQGTKVAGTSHLKRHIAKGACPTVLRAAQEQNNNDNNNSPYTPVALKSAPKRSGSDGATQTPPIKRRYRTAAATPFFSFDPDRCRHEISRMIIMHEYPLHIVEHSGFVSFVRNLQPRFDMVSFNTVQGDCVATYLREKQSVQRMIESMPGRISLMLDVWSSCHRVGYVFITGQFIDSEWKIHRKILNVIMEPSPNSETAFGYSIAACLSDWGMEGKLFSVTVNQRLTDPAADNIRALLSVKNPLILNGQLLLGNCLARTLSRIAVGALNYVDESVKKVRDSVRYVKTSESHEEKFNELKRHLQVPTMKNLSLEDKTQWNTTYEMLLAASELKEVFYCLDTSDPDYRGGPSMDDWKRVEVLCSHLRILFDTANLLTATTTVPTTNTFFHEAWKIQLELARAAASDDPFVSSLTKPMKDKFDEYWKSCCLVLAIAVVMDPRFKMMLVDFSFKKIYGEEASEYVRIVDEGAHELFLEYVSEEAGMRGAVKTEDAGATGNGLGFSDFDMYIMETTSQLAKSELDQYLEESLLPRVHEFDVIGWWKVNRKKYPTLSKMARDVLTVPVCTVPPGSVFCTDGKEMDRYRCSLRPETVEALICAKDWLQSEPAETINEPIKMELPM